MSEIDWSDWSSEKAIEELRDFVVKHNLNPIEEAKRCSRSTPSLATQDFSSSSLMFGFSTVKFDSVAFETQRDTL